MYASGDAPPRSRIRPPRMLGVLAQNAHMYTLGMTFLDGMLMHGPCSQSSHDSL